MKSCGNHLPGLGHVLPITRVCGWQLVYSVTCRSFSRTCTQPVTIATLLPLTLKLEAIHLKHWYQPARLQHSFINWKSIIWIFAAMKTSNLKGMLWISDREVNTVLPLSPVALCFVTNIFAVTDTVTASDLWCRTCNLKCYFGLYNSFLIFIPHSP